MGSTAEGSAQARDRIIQGAIRSFSTTQYRSVSVDDIAAEAMVSKSAVYAHFGSKSQLAKIIIESDLATLGVKRDSIIARELPGLESFIVVIFATAVHDLTSVAARARLRLVRSTEHGSPQVAKHVGPWFDAMSELTERARAQNDLKATHAPDLTRFIVASYLGLQQLHLYRDAEAFLRQLEQTWLWILPSLVWSDRISYFDEFIRRRTAHAIAATRPDITPTKPPDSQRG